MADLAAVLQELDMAQYLPSFIHNGFDSWSDVLDITEHDLDVLGVKLGHRRRLQQRIARERGLFQTQQGQSRPCDDLSTQEGAPRKKRRYRWHPKPDPNAPKKPLTAYAQFANEKRKELRHRGLSFADMAIEIGKMLRELPDHEKKEAQARAIRARDEYKEAVAVYKTTEEFREYQRYLREWKAKRYSRKIGIIAEEISSSGYSGDLESTTSPSTTTTTTTTENTTRPAGSHNLNVSSDERAPKNPNPWLLSSSSTSNDFIVERSAENHNSNNKFAPPPPPPPAMSCCSLPVASTTTTMPETVWWTTTSTLQSDTTAIWNTQAGGGAYGGFSASYSCC